VNLVRVAAAGLLLGIGLHGLPDVSRIALLFESKQEVRVTEPSDDLKKLVEPISKIVDTMTNLDKLWFRDVYINATRVVLADGEMKAPSITDTVVLRKVHITVLEFIWKGMADNAPKKYPHLKTEVDAALEAAIGLDPKPVDAEVRDAAGDVFNAIAWVANGGK